MSVFFHKPRLIKLIIILYVFAPNEAISQTSGRINEIRKMFGEVERQLPSAKLVSIDEYYSEEFDGGASQQVQGWRSPKDEFIKIVLTESADWHEESTSFYLKDNDLFFVFIKGYYAGEMYTPEELNISEEEYYQNGGEAKSLDLYEKRIYFDGNEVIQLLTKDKNVPTGPELPDLSNVQNVVEPIDQKEWSYLQSMYKDLIDQLSK